MSEKLEEDFSRLRAENEALREALIHVTRFSTQQSVRSHAQHVLDYFSYPKMGPVSDV